MIARLALRNLVSKPWRSVFLLLGYSVGVAVMIVLLSIGEALVSQARNEKLIGGGDVTVLPQGIDVEVLKTGGLGGLFFSIDHAEFIYRQLLAAPRLAAAVEAAAPQIADKLLYLRLPDGREQPVLATGEVPSLSAAVGAAPGLAAGAWVDDARDLQWRSATAAQLRTSIFRLIRREAIPPGPSGTISMSLHPTRSTGCSFRSSWVERSQTAGGAGRSSSRRTTSQWQECRRRSANSWGQSPRAPLDSLRRAPTFRSAHHL